MEHLWRWAGACSVGTSHIRTGRGCDDSAACIEYQHDNGSALLAVVSDGAGSAQFSSLGSRAVVREFISAAVSFLRSGRSLCQIDDEIGRQWTDAIRDKIFHMAERLSAMPRDFAATLVGIILCDDEFVLCHVGDGACAIRKREGHEWLVPSWPAHGEYASSTYFVTDEPVVNLRITRWQGDFSDVAVFSDGLERLVLDFSQRVAFQPFFDSMLKPLSGIGPGRSRRLSVGLRTFLDSSIVADRTDDDKSLIIATRARTT